MKKIILTLAVALLGITAAHTQEKVRNMVVIGTDGSMTKFEISKVQDVTFEYVDVDPVIETDVFTVNGVSFTMVRVPGGTFTMGATDEQGSDAYSNEKPTHSVTLSNYMIGETEVTQALWEAVMGSNPSSFGGANKPVEQVSWNDCQEFITKLNQLTGEVFRLPTEAEWEYAARGGKSGGTKYAGSDVINTVGWYSGNSGSTTHDVATLTPNSLGIYDMTGNVWEWCQDWYGSYSSAAQTNPTGPTTGSYRVLRGGSWFLGAANCRVSSRFNFTPTYGYYDVGLRLVRVLEGASEPAVTLEAPLSVTAMLDTESSVSISWEAVAGAQSYTVYRSADNTSYSPIASGITGTTYIDSAPLDGAPNYYRIIAVAESEMSSPTSPVLISDNKMYTVNGISFKMIAVPGGTFTMGATDEQGSDAYSNEKPTHSVTLSNYMIGETEVTQALWEAVMGSNPSSFGGANKPVEQVSWNDCQEFITKLNQLTGEVFRLPTEAEWEYAARGGKSGGTKYAGSDDISTVAWYYANSGNTTHDVATLSPNSLGIYDMSGNVCEWCQDWYGSYSSAAQTNPTGPSTGSSCVLRGGSWSDVPSTCRVSYREDFTPAVRGSFRGLRLAR